MFQIYLIPNHRNDPRPAGQS